jgi:hypothetical protein
MGGEQRIKEPLKADPNIKAIVSSGHTGSSVLRNFRDYGFALFLKKPYSFDDLKEGLEALLW